MPSDSSPQILAHPDYARLETELIRRLSKINAAAREHELSYSRFMNGLKTAGIDLDRKALADLAVREPQAFAALAEQAKASLQAN